MDLPLGLIELDNKLAENWETRFRTRPIREGVWRRHQAQENAELSGWSPDNNRKIKIVHYRDVYSKHGNQFVLDSPYLYFAVHNDPSEIQKYLDLASSAMRAGGWHRRRLGHLSCQLKWKKRSFEFTIRPTSFVPSRDLIERPWKIFALGPRRTIPRGNPNYAGVESVLEFLPGCVELGCGPSIEAGVLPLKHLHSVYSIMRSDKSFIFEADEDRIFEFLSRPEEKYREACDIHVSCLKAQPSSFYHDLRKLVEWKAIELPVFNNNFDGLLPSVGIEEYYLRQHDKDGTYPEYQFGNARSLIVVGSHADRRGATESARRRGMQIIFINPERYEDPDGLKDCPLESPQTGDIVIQMKASEAMSQVRRLVEEQL